MNIVFEDDYILVLEKPTGLVVNRAETVNEETLQDQLSDYFGLGVDLGIGDRAGIVHRLDRETSGLLVVAKTEEAFINLQAQFKSREVKKIYTALVHGLFHQSEGIVEGSIGRVGSFGKFGVTLEGRLSKTDYKVVAKYRLKESFFNELPSDYTKQRINYLKRHAVEFSLVNLFPKSGRTHQIRVHMKSLNHPLVSDLIYAPQRLIKFDLRWCPRLFLHAKHITFMHPKTKKEVSFDSSLPVDLKKALVCLSTFDN